MENQHQREEKTVGDIKPDIFDISMELTEVKATVELATDTLVRAGFDRAMVDALITEKDRRIRGNDLGSLITTPPLWKRDIAAETEFVADLTDPYQYLWNLYTKVSSVFYQYAYDNKVDSRDIAIHIGGVPTTMKDCEEAVKLYQDSLHNPWHLDYFKQLIKKQKLALEASFEMVKNPKGEEMAEWLGVTCEGKPWTKDKLNFYPDPVNSAAFMQDNDPINLLARAGRVVLARVRNLNTYGKLLSQC